ncbi:hypothetical protein PENSPDRAFT_82320 [Peniophora sp. CONT]|nr:hypothetical protein PENSPDRAFT_82320 [Peniophora sp. CONT]
MGAPSALAHRRASSSHITLRRRAATLAFTINALGMACRRDRFVRSMQSRCLLRPESMQRHLRSVAHASHRTTWPFASSGQVPILARWRRPMLSPVQPSCLRAWTMNDFWDPPLPCANNSTARSRLKFRKTSRPVWFYSCSFVHSVRQLSVTKCEPRSSKSVHAALCDAFWTLSVAVSVHNMRRSTEDIGV